MKYTVKMRASRQGSYSIEASTINVVEGTPPVLQLTSVDMVCVAAFPLDMVESITADDVTEHSTSGELAHRLR